MSDIRGVVGREEDVRHSSHVNSASWRGDRNKSSSVNYISSVSHEVSASIIEGRERDCRESRANRVVVVQVHGHRDPSVVVCHLSLRVYHQRNTRDRRRLYSNLIIYEDSFRRLSRRRRNR